MIEDGTTTLLQENVAGSEGNGGANAFSEFCCAAFSGAVAAVTVTVRKEEGNKEGGRRIHK